MANPTQLGAAAPAPAPAPAPVRAAAAGHPMENFVLHVGFNTLFLSAAAMILALAWDPPQVSPCHLILLFLLFANGFCLIHVSPALRRFPRAVAVARVLHRFLWEPRG